MRRSLAAVLAAVLVAFILAACGGGSTTTVTTTAHPPSSAPGRALMNTHPCDPKTNMYYMQCAFAAPGQLPGTGPFRGTAYFGLDFAWGGPSGSYAKAHGAHFAISYLSWTSKDWTGSLLASYRAAGLGIGFVYETSAGRALGGCPAANYDVSRATSETRALGYPTAPIFFATDFDTSGYSTSGVIGAYYHCVAAALGSRSGAYGGRRTVEIAHAQGVRWLWQTLAWSYGSWYSATGACVRQTRIDTYWYGYSVDYDLSLCDGWQANSKPPPPPFPYTRFPEQKIKIYSERISERNTVKTWDAHKCARPAQRTVCKTSLNHLQMLKGRVWSVAHRHKPPDWGDWRGWRYQQLAHRSSLIPHYPYTRHPAKAYKVSRRKLSERTVVENWDRNCPTPAPQCKTLRTDLRLLKGRVWTVAHQHGRPDWTYARRGWRFQQLAHRYQAHQST